MRTIPPPLRHPVEGRRATQAEERRALAQHTADLLTRIDQLCQAPCFEPSR